jgi:autotransporter-associated beta strand protein
MNHTKPLLKSLAVLAGALILTVNLAFGATTTWIGGAADKLWSSGSNWSPSLPTNADDVVLGDVDATGTAGAGTGGGSAGNSNSIVDVGFASSIKSLWITNSSGFQNLRLTNNLNIAGSGAVPSLFVGTGANGPNANQTVYATISGKAALTVTNTSGYLRVVQGTINGGAAGTFKATLDMTGLDMFAANVSMVQLAYNATSAGDYLNANRPCAALLFAKTNYVTCTTQAFGESNQQGGAASTERLGQVNFFNVDNLWVGGRKCNATMNFNTGWSSPIVSFRNKAGTGRGNWYIGDLTGSYGAGTGTSAATGVMDLSLGSVDALVETIYVGHGFSTTGSANTAVGTGTLTIGVGTLDVNSLNIGYQQANYSVGKGTVNVNASGLLKVNGNVSMAHAGTSAVNLPTATLYVAGTNTIGGNLVDGGGTSTIRVNNGKLIVAGSVVDGGGIDGVMITNNGLMTVAGNFSLTNSTITLATGGMLDLKPAGDTAAGDFGVQTLNLGSASLTNFSTFGVSTINLTAPATAFTLYPGQALAPATAGIIGMLTVNGGLTLTNAALKLDLGSTYDQVAVTGALELDGTNSVLITPLLGFGAGSYPVMTYGTSFTGNPANNILVGGPIANSRYTFSFDNNTANTLMLNVGGAGPATLTWSGDGSSNMWDLAQGAKWNAGAGANTEKFYNLDNVTFDDSGSASPAVNLVGTLIPGSVTVNGTKSYSFGGSGKISGPNGLMVNSSSTLTILTTNDYAGTTVINGGATVQLGDGTTADGALGTGEIQNNGALVFKPASLQTITSFISSSGALTKTGPGTTVLSGANTFSSLLTIAAGTLRAGNAAALGDTYFGTTINNGATMDIGGFNLGSEPVTVSGAGVGGAGAIINSGATQGNALNTVTLAGDTVFGGPNRWDISGLNGSSAEPGLLANGYKLTKVANNQVSVTSYNPNWVWSTGLGDIDVQSGILSVQCYVTLGENSKTLTIRSNAAIEFCHNGPTIMDKPISLTSGCIQARYFSASYPAYVDLTGPITLNGSNVFDVFSASMPLIVESEIAGSGSLVKGIGRHTEGGNTSTGVGTLILVASNSFSGDLQVQTGTLVLSNTASVTKAANIIMAGGTLDASQRGDLTLTLAGTQTLKGNGTLLGTVTSPATTTVSPGVSTTAATLNVTGSVNLGGSTVMDITKTNTAVAADKLAATGTIDLGGNLTVNFSGNTKLAAGDKFTLLSAAGYLHSFANTNLPALLPGLAWSNSVVSGAWNIEVIATEPTARPVLTTVLAGGNLTLSWDTAYSSYVLEGQTNAPGTGLSINSANWHPVPGVSGNHIALPIDPANGSVFFRLKQ